jgi:hypothetical protein
MKLILASLSMLLSINSFASDYSTSEEQSCASGYVEGIIDIGGDLYDRDPRRKECLGISTLKDKYVTHENGKCAKGYAEGAIFTIHNPFLAPRDPRRKECVKTN